MSPVLNAALPAALESITDMFAWRGRGSGARSTSVARSQTPQPVQRTRVEHVWSEKEERITRFSSLVRFRFFSSALRAPRSVLRA
eukprot:6530543-Prymnesium_polylepis.1